MLENEEENLVVEDEGSETKKTEEHVACMPVYTEEEKAMMAEKNAGLYMFSFLSAFTHLYSYT